MSEFRKLVNQIMENHKEIDPIQVGPVYETWSLASLMQSDLIESDNIEIEHPRFGTGHVVEIDSSGDRAEVRWDRLGSWATNSEYLTREEARMVVVTNNPKYACDQLSEDYEMHDIELTGEDLQALYENDGFDVPKPSNTILTKQSEFHSDASGKPLSSLDGEGGKTTEPHEEGKTTPDEPSTPPVASMEEPSRKISMSGSNKPKKAPTDASSDQEDNTSEDDDMTNETFSLEEADFENMDENYMDEESYMEHDMAAGEIAVTKEFLEKLISAACASNLDTGKIEQVVDCVADCCEEDRTLTVDDIGMVMSKLKDKVGGGDSGDKDELMGDMEEGSQESRDRGRMRRDHKKNDKGRFHNDGGNRPKYRKPKPSKDEVEEGELPDALKKHQIKKGSDKDGDGELNEAWMSSIPHVGNKRDLMDTTGMSEDDIEIANIKRLANI